ncbi:hypothetical protein [Mycolicibacterium fluoranthenivorans]|uniref:Uncharacterized protein n=1 Tax=Mycolicibacterium fluoranthenivorans TaxID=258505 RepID=A0A7X5ZG63_9MYCO|nr:hypothetical protein [Mycolicibacterium fluoranthenivorans]MCV7354477.1 hypothetical protein [Mycolicibacterium fluoranthenivorans]NIH98920.1 hypothetical protein [Mycolicibacterium fluoranthenivorans]
MDDDNGFDLVMPFVSVQSKGGPHDDSAFAAGYAMGLLDAELGGSVFDQGRAIRVEDRAQADLIAMRHGFIAEFSDPSECMCEDHADNADEWLFMTVRRAVVDPSDAGPRV